METPRAPYTYQNSDQSLKFMLRLQSQPLAELSSAKGFVNDWLTVTNRVPPVNDAQGHFWVTEDGVTGGPRDRLPGSAFALAVWNLAF